MTAHIARAALTPEDEALLASVRKALSNIWADPVIVRHVAMSRSAARAIERHLTALSLRRAHSRRVGAAIPTTGSPITNTAPCTSTQPTLTSGCEGRAAASDKRRGDRRSGYSLRMVRNDEIFCFDHGDTNAC